MKIIITESQFKRTILLEQTLDNDALKSIYKANSWFTPSFKKDYKSEYNSVKKHIDIDNILNNFTSYLNSISESIWLDIKYGKTPDMIINSLFQKLNSLTADEYKNIGSTKKFFLKRVVKSEFKTKNDFVNYLLDPPGTSFDHYDYESLIRSVFVRMRNWLLDDLNRLDKLTKQKIIDYSDKAVEYINGVSKPSYVKLINVAAKDLYV